MKKKGLIISTIVMVVVLIASLTTATYAWFTNTGSATVTDINFAVSSASDLVIGVKNNNTYAASPAWSAFRYDNTQYSANDNTWSGTNGLGLSVNTRLDLSQMQKAVYSFSSVSASGYIYEEDATVVNEAGHYYLSGESTYTECPKSPDAPTKTFTRTQGYTGTQTTYTKGADQEVETGLVRAEDEDEKILKAAGSGNDVTAGTLELATKNTDYLDVVFGVAASNNEVAAFGLYVYVSNNQTISSLGMNAAIHVIYSVDGGAYTELDLYGAKGQGDANDSVTAPTLPSVTIGSKTCDLMSATDWTAIDAQAGDVALYIPIYNGWDSEGSKVNYATTGAAGIHQIHLIMYICGPDDDCVTAATGTGATISLKFLDVNKGTYTAA